MLGKTHELRGVQRHDARKQLVAVDVLLGKFIAENAESQTVFGLNDITLHLVVRAAMQAVG